MAAGSNRRAAVTADRSVLSRLRHISQLWTFFGRWQSNLANRTSPWPLGAGWSRPIVWDVQQAKSELGGVAVELHHLHVPRKRDEREGRSLMAHVLDRRSVLKLAAAGLSELGFRSAGSASTVSVRAFGATGEISDIQTAAVNRAIDAVSRQGGGTVYFPPGIYRCHTIHLKNRTRLYFERGAVILAAPQGGFDTAESNLSDQYQDFGHCHFDNSLIVGKNLQQIAIEGPGLIWGKGLSRGVDKWWGMGGSLPPADRPGVANKAIALKSCTDVTLRDFMVLEGGHFGILATGIDTMLVDGLLIDTNRDGMNLDCCRNVQIRNTRVNSPYDDGIVIKSSFALGDKRASEGITVEHCYVTGGYEVGALHDGSKRLLATGGGRVGRIKLGTESIGDFRNITIRNCELELCRGVALETVDGGDLEDVVISNIRMRGIHDGPLFFRLGARLRAPHMAAVGSFRNVTVDGLDCREISCSMPAILSGIPGHMIENIVLRNLNFVQQGGDPRREAALTPAELVSDYPEADMFGEALPAKVSFARHVNGLQIETVTFATVRPDERPDFWFDNVRNWNISGFDSPTGIATPTIYTVESYKHPADNPGAY
jgi:polygalacturonase